jgi:hypothetical protein
MRIGLDQLPAAAVVVDVVVCTVVVVDELEPPGLLLQPATSKESVATVSAATNGPARRSRTTW